MLICFIIAKATVACNITHIFMYYMLVFNGLSDQLQIADGLTLYKV